MGTPADRYSVGESLVTDLLEGEGLAHFGVKGQKWGVRRSREERAAASADAARAAELSRTAAKKGGLKELGNDEIRELVERMRLEQDYARLKGTEQTKIDAGHEKVKKLVNIAKTAQEIHKLTTSPAGRALEKELAKKSPKLAKRVASREAAELAQKVAKELAKEAAKEAKKK